MNESGELGPAESFKTVKVKDGEVIPQTSRIATEIPFTIMANQVELATLMCSPSDLKEMAYGFLFTSGFIMTAEDVISVRLDRQRWKVLLKIKNDPDPDIMGKRLYTSGCGKGIIYSNIHEITLRTPLDDSFRVPGKSLNSVMKWLQTGSPLHRETRGVHSAALSVRGKVPGRLFDDVGRHNAVDKVIGRALLEKTGLTRCLLLSTGRISSEVLHKAKKGGIPVVVTLSAPTHQAILLAEAMNITLVCFAKGISHTIFTHQERIEI